MVSPLDPALVLTPSPRALTLSPRELSPRGMLMLLSSMEPTDTLTPTPTHTPMFPSAPAPVLTPSPRALMLPPRDMLPTPTGTDSPDMPMESKSSLRRDQ